MVRDVCQKVKSRVHLLYLRSKHCAIAYRTYNKGMRNIRPFREEPTVLNKVVVALAYVLLAWVVTSTSIVSMGGLLSIFFILGLLLWIFVIRQSRIKYFVRYHLVQAFLLFISIVAVLWLLAALISLLMSIPGLNYVAGMVAFLLFDPYLGAGAYHFSVKDVVLMTLGVVLAVYALRGRYTEIPWITDGVRHWL